MKTESKKVRLFVLADEFKGTSLPTAIIAPVGNKTKKGETKDSQSHAIAERVAGVKRSRINACYNSFILEAESLSHFKSIDWSKAVDCVSTTPEEEPEPQDPAEARTG